MAKKAAFAAIQTVIAVIFAASLAVIFSAFRSTLQHLRPLHAWVCAVRVGARAAQAGVQAGRRVRAPRRQARFAADTASLHARAFFSLNVVLKKMVGWA